MTINIINEYAVNDNDDDNNGRISLQSVAMTIASELNNKCEIVPGKNRWGNQPSFLIIPNDPTQYYKIRIWSMTHPRTGEPYPTYNTILYGDGVAQHAERAVPSTYASATKTAKLMPKANKAMRITKKSDKSNKGILETANQNISEMLKKCMNIVDQYWSNSELKLDYSDPGSYVLQSLGQNKVSQICAKLANQFANSARLQMYYRTPGHYIEDLAKQNNLLEQSEVLEATGLKPETIKRYLEVARKQRDELKKHQKQSTEYRGIAKRMSDRREAGIERAEKRLSDIENRNVSEELNENLRAWFGKGKEGGAGGGGWDRYNTKGERIGKCGERKPGEGKPKCLSKQKAAQLRAKGGKKAIAAAVNKKRREDPNPTRRGAAKMVSNKTRSKKTNESLQESWKSIGFDLRSDVLWPALLFESVNPQKSTDFKAWINQQRESQKEPAIGSKCILAMLNHVGDIIMVFYGDAIYAGQNESYYMLKTSSGTHEYSKLNQLVFASEQDFEQFMLLLQMKFQDDNIKIDTQKLAVMETKTSKVVSENTDDFRRDLLARVKEKAAKMQADTAIARAKNPDLWKWNVGDEVKSNKTGKTYTIIYTSMSPKYGAMYGYMRGDKYSDDYEQGQFIAALAHKSLHRIGSQELDESVLTELVPDFRDDDNESDPEEFLRRLAAQWWHGSEQEMEKVERILQSMGWEIGEDEGSYENGGVFVVRIGDHAGHSFLNWPSEDLSLDESITEEQLDELKCWPGYTRVKGVPAGAPGSCKKKTNEGVAEDKISEGVEDNYLYHSTKDAKTAKAILQSGVFKAGRSAQDATTAQVGDVRTVSFGRNLAYQLSGENVDRDYEVVFVVDRNALKSRYKTIATSQSSIVKGLGYGTGMQSGDRQNQDPKLVQMLKRREQLYKGYVDTNKDGQISKDEIKQNPDYYNKYFASKSGEEYEEVVPVKTGTIPWKGMLVGFYLIPGKAASKDPELLNHPLRLDMPRPNTFVKATQQQGVTEGSQQINWVKPNFDFEWHEVEEQSRMKQVPADVRQYYQKHFPNKDAWLKAVQNGKAVMVQPDHNYEIRNAPYDKTSLQKVLAPTGHEGPIGPAKEKRVNDLFDKGKVEMPIILKTSQGLWLIGGKTRLGTANYVKGLPATVWLIGGKQSVTEGSGQEPGWFEIYNLRTMQRVHHPFEADNIMDAEVKADDWLEAIGKSGRGLGVRPVKEQDMTEEKCPHCSGPLVEFSQLNEKKDACYYKVKSRYKVWPSAYASGALVKCRKVGAKNWGNKSKTNESNDRERLWILYADDTAVAKYVSEKEAQRAMLDLRDKYSSVKFKIVHQSEKDAIATNTKKIGGKHAKG